MSVVKNVKTAELIQQVIHNIGALPIQNIMTEIGSALMEKGEQTMLDREKVIKGLELCEIGTGEKCFETDCPYYYKECTEDLKNDILELLKEQEAVKPKSKVRHGAYAQIQHFCGNCMTMLHGKPKFCSECGKPVLWEER